MSNEGFTRNLLHLTGYHGLFNGIGDKPIKLVSLNEDKTIFTITFNDDSTAQWKVEGDCCSQSWIEHLELPNDYIGEKIIAVFDDVMDRKDDDENYECLQVYKTTFRTHKGDITLEYRNSSNGYYGGYLVRVDEKGEEIT